MMCYFDLQRIHSIQISQVDGSAGFALWKIISSFVKSMMTISETTSISTESNRSSIITSKLRIKIFVFFPSIWIIKNQHVVVYSSDTIEMILSSESPDDDDLEDERLIKQKYIYNHILIILNFVFLQKCRFLEVY